MLKYKSRMSRNARVFHQLYNDWKMIPVKFYCDNCFPGKHVTIGTFIIVIYGKSSFTHYYELGIQFASIMKTYCIINELFEIEATWTVPSSTGPSSTWAVLIRILSTPWHFDLRIFRPKPFQQKNVSNLRRKWMYKTVYFLF